MESCSPRLLKTIGDHAFDYHERYVHPPVVFVAEKFAAVKKALISRFLESHLSSQEVLTLMAKCDSINVQRASTLEIPYALTVK